jgi:hypothetical protein
MLLVEWGWSLYLQSSEKQGIEVPVLVSGLEVDLWD